MLYDEEFSGFIGILMTRGLANEFPVPCALSDGFLEVEGDIDDWWEYPFPQEHLDQLQKLCLITLDGPSRISVDDSLAIDTAFEIQGVLLTPGTWKVIEATIDEELDPDGKPNRKIAGPNGQTYVLSRRSLREAQIEGTIKHLHAE